VKIQKNNIFYLLKIPAVVLKLANTVVVCPEKLRIANGFNMYANKTPSAYWSSSLIGKSVDVSKNLEDSWDFTNYGQLKNIIVIHKVQSTKNSLISSFFIFFHSSSS